MPDLHRPLQILQAPLAQVAQTGTRRQALRRQVANRAGEEDLTAVAGGEEAGDPVEGGPK